MNKKRIVISVILLICVFFTSCSKEKDKEHIPNNFPLSSESVQEIIDKADLPFTVGDISTADMGENVENITYILETKTAEGEVYGIGPVQVIYGEHGTAVEMFYRKDVLVKQEIYENVDLEKTVFLGCNLYGGFNDIEGLCRLISDAEEKGQIHTYDKKTFWYSEFEGVHCIVDFAYLNDYYKRKNIYTVTGFTAMDDVRFKEYVDKKVELGYDWAKELM